MNEQLDKLNTVVVKRYASTGENQQPELALVTSTCDAPTFSLLDAEGNRYHWRQDLTRPATADETARYWQVRAEIAERLNEKTLNLVSKLQDQNVMLIDQLNSRTE